MNIDHRTDEDQSRQERHAYNVVHADEVAANRAFIAWAAAEELQPLDGGKTTFDAAFRAGWEARGNEQA